MKAGLDREKILHAAADMADKNGIANVTLKTLAENLGIKSPSLYKHFSEGLDELRQELMLYGWKSLEAVTTKAAIGKAKDDAIIAICHAFRDYVTQHRGVYEAMQWYNMYRSEEDLKATEEIVSVLFQVLDGYNLTDDYKVHTVRMLRGFLQGFTTIECHGGYGNPLPLDDTFDFALKIMLNGIRDLQEG